jgi:hypothetical protein
MTSHECAHAPDSHNPRSQVTRKCNRRNGYRDVIERDRGRHRQSGCLTAAELARLDRYDVVNGDLPVVRNDPVRSDFGDLDLVLLAVGRHDQGPVTIIALFLDEVSACIVITPVAIMCESDPVAEIDAEYGIASCLMS